LNYIYKSGGDELMKKIKLIIAAVAMLSLVSSSAVYADGFAAGEGLYVGAFVGMNTGIVQPKVATDTGAENLSHTDSTFEATEGGLALEGVEGGALVGYGYKMGDLYAGIEGEWAAGDTEFELTSTTVININSFGSGTAATCTGCASQYEIAAGTVVKAEKKWTGGLSGRLGYYVNPNTLFAVRGGVLVSKFDVAYGTAFSETFYGGGPSVGISMESKLAEIDPNLNLRVGAVYTDYLTAPVSGIGTMVEAGEAGSVTNSEITGSGLSARIGLTYSFFDANSLF
jgi:uncharacterized protein YuzB (UPF0349 family)